MDGSNHAAVMFDVDDVDGLEALLASTPPDVAAQPEAHGVIQPMTVYVAARVGMSPARHPRQGPP